MINVTECLDALNALDHFNWPLPLMLIMGIILGIVFGWIMCKYLMEAENNNASRKDNQEM